MAITKEDVQAIAPELAGTAIPAATWAALLADSALLVNAAQWGKRADLAQKYMCAHLAALAYPDLAAGIVVSESAGPVSRTYAVGQALEAGILGSTRFGAHFAQLRRTFRTTPLVP